MGTRLLLVDTDGALRDLIIRDSGRAEREIIAVSAPRDALPHIRAPQPIDLVIVGDGPDGAAVLEVLSVARPTCPIVVAARSPSLDGAVAALRAGAVDYVRPPFDLDKLEAAIGAGLASGEVAARLVRSQQLETVGRIVGGVAHDFNNLLVVITNFAELIAEMCHGETDSPIAEAADSITAAGRSAATLTRQMLELARHKPPVIEPVALADVIAGTERFLRSAIGPHIRLVLAPADQPRTAAADRGHLEHVLLNLAIFARDTMPGGSTLTVSATGDGDRVYIDVHASGANLADDELERLFQPYHVSRGALAGSGFGLSAARELIGALGGSLTAYAPPQGGTAFRIELPEPRAKSPA